MRRILALVVTVCAVAAADARAATINWEFEAIVRGSTGVSASMPLWDTLVLYPGQVLRGSLSFDSSVADEDLTGQSGRYASPVLALDVEYMYDPIDPQIPGPYNLGFATSSATSWVFVVNSFSISADSVSIVSGIQSQLPGTSSIQTFGITVLQQIDGPSLWNNAAMVLVPPHLSEVRPFDLALFETGTVNGLILSSESNLYRVGAELTFLQAVPEPGDSFVVLMGLLAVLGCRCALRREALAA